MAYDSKYKRVETADELYKKSIIGKILVAQMARDSLFRALYTKTESMAKITRFRDFVVAFNSLLQSTRHSIARDTTIKSSWPKKEEKYIAYLSKSDDDGYSVKRMKDGLKLFSDFESDMVTVNMFKILDEIGEGGEAGWEEEEYGEND